VLNDANILTSH